MKKTEKKSIFEMTGTQIAEVYGITESAVSQWDCPRLKHGGYDLRKVEAWKEQKRKDVAPPSDRAAAELEKLRLQCKKLEADVDDRLKNTVPLDEYARDFEQCASELRNYFTEFALLNLHRLLNVQKIEELREYWAELVKAACNNFLKQIQKIEEEKENG